MSGSSVPNGTEGSFGRASVDFRIFILSTSYTLSFPLPYPHTNTAQILYDPLVSFWRFVSHESTVHDDLVNFSPLHCL